MRNKIKQILLSLALLLPVVAIAHPGHGVSDGSSWVHYLLSPIHVGVGVVMILVVLSAVSYYRRRKNQSSE
jgi:protein-S-isoprenylcysteine O-methyltransferase Ste14